MKTLLRRLAPIAFAAIAAAAPAQDAPKAEDAKETKDPAAPQRADLGQAYLRLDRAYAAHPPTDEKRVAEINQGFDQATLAFFGGKYAEAIKTINGLTASLDEKTAKSPAYAIAASLKLTGQDPIIPYVNFVMAVAPRIVSMYPVDLEPAGTLELRFQVKDERGEVQQFLDHAFNVATGPAAKVDSTFAAFQDELVAGHYDVEIVGPDDFSFLLGKWHIIPRPLKEIQTENEKRLAAARADTPELQHAVAICKLRNEILGDIMSPHKSARVVFDPNEVIRDLEKEIAAIEQGKNPYHRRAGDLWRALPFSPKPVPYRLYAPKAAAGDTAAPLVIALHGAGGDENMFMDGYGAGVIKKLADERGFIVVSPATSLFSGSNGAFEALLDAVSLDYAIDRKRVYVIGHSMGAGATAGFAKKYHDKIAAACCMAGGSAFTGGEGLAPTLVICAELDAVVPLARVQPAAEAAIAAGLPLEFRLMKNHGHTLMVGKAIPEAIDWLFAHPK